MSNSVWTDDLLEHLQKRVAERYKGMQLLSIDEKPTVKQVTVGRSRRDAYYVTLSQYVLGEYYYARITLTGQVAGQDLAAVAEKVDGELAYAVMDLRAYIAKHIGEGGEHAE